MIDIGAIWGDIVIPKWRNDESHTRERGKVIILTQNFNIINDTVEIIINKTSFRITVVEDFKESENVGPKFPLHPHNMEDNDEDEKLIDSDQSMCDENSEFGFDGDDLEIDGEDNSEHAQVDADTADVVIGESLPKLQPTGNNGYQNTTVERSPELQATRSNEYQHIASSPVKVDAEESPSMLAGGAVPEVTPSTGSHKQHRSTNSHSQGGSWPSLVGSSYNPNSFGSPGPILVSQSSPNQQLSSTPHFNELEKIPVGKEKRIKITNTKPTDTTLVAGAAAAGGGRRRQPVVVGFLCTRTKENEIYDVNNHSTATYQNNRCHPTRSGRDSGSSNPPQKSPARWWWLEYTHTRTQCANAAPPSSNRESFYLSSSRLRQQTRWSSVFILAGGPKRSSDGDAGGCSRQRRCLPVAPDAILFSGHECNRSNKDEGDGDCRWCVDLVGSLSRFPARRRRQQGAR
ncbi:hypothetical protein LXL04_037377 [Taraxacum kok-saghyz]